jgi:hypothetical protein
MFVTLLPVTGMFGSIALCEPNLESRSSWKYEGDTESNKQHQFVYVLSI